MKKKNIRVRQEYLNTEKGGSSNFEWEDQKKGTYKEEMDCDKASRVDIFKAHSKKSNQQE